MRNRIKIIKGAIMEFRDQLDHIILLPEIPKRVISLVPSQTELLFDLGLQSEVVGVTKFCVHPESWFRNKTRIGGTKNLNIEKIKTLGPDLILANKEENDRAQVEQLNAIAPVWTSNIQNLDDALQMILIIGEMVNRKEAGKSIRAQIESRFRRLDAERNSSKEGKAIYLIWQEPYMAAGSDTFIHDMIQRCGLYNIIQQTRYPVLDLEEIRALNPDYIFLSSEPFPFKEKHAKALQNILPDAAVRLVDGQMFSWYGSRLLKAGPYFENLITNLQ